MLVKPSADGLENQTFDLRLRGFRDKQTGLKAFLFWFCFDYPHHHYHQWFLLPLLTASTTCQYQFLQVLYDECIPWCCSVYQHFVKSRMVEICQLHPGFSSSFRAYSTVCNLFFYCCILNSCEFSHLAKASTQLVSIDYRWHRMLDKLRLNGTVNHFLSDPLCDLHANKQLCVSDKWFSDIKQWIISLCLGSKLSSL